MIDWQTVTNLSAEIGSDGMAELVELFLEEVETAIAPLRSGDTVDELEATMHFLKGCALNLGFAEFAKLCLEGETQAANGMGDSVDVAAVVVSYDASKALFLGEWKTHITA